MPRRRYEAVRRQDVVMRYRKEVKEAIIKMLETKLDRRLTHHGFKRNPRSLEYRRTIPEAKQVIFMDFASHPSHDPRADAYIYPFTFIGIPCVYDLALKMVADPSLIDGRLEKTLAQPIDWAAPKGQRPRWYLTGEDEIMNAGDSIGDHIERWVFPFLEEFSSVRGLVKAFETRDERTYTLQDDILVCVAAAYLLLDNPTSAKAVLEQNLGCPYFIPEVRARYAKAFDFVERRLAN